MRLFLLLLVLSPQSGPSWWKVQTSGLDTNLRGVSVVSLKSGPHVVWASGSKGVILRSTDDGTTWRQLSVEGGSNLDFRDIEAFSADVAYVMSAGNGEQSRIYKTTDGGQTWKLQYSDKRPGFFLDSLACDSRTHCFALSDPVDGKFLVLATDDGEHWQELPRDNMPPALPNEGAFAASGTAIALCRNGAIYFGTGGPAARVFRSTDRGRSWKVFTTPLPAAASSGIFGLTCVGRSKTLAAVGGDYRQPAQAGRVAIYSRDGGGTWQLSRQQPGGFRSAVASFAKGELVAVGTNGTDMSFDSGIRWTNTDPLNLNSVAFAGGEGWAVGPRRTIAHFTYLPMRRK